MFLVVDGAICVTSARPSTRREYVSLPSCNTELLLDHSLKLHGASGTMIVLPSQVDVLSRVTLSDTFLPGIFQHQSSNKVIQSHFLCNRKYHKPRHRCIFELRLMGGQPRLTLINPSCAMWSDKHLFIKNNGTTYRVVSATDALRGARRTTSRADHRERGVANRSRRLADLDGGQDDSG